MMKTGLIFVMGRRLSQTQAQDVSSSLCTQLLALASAHSLMGFRPLLDDIRGIAVEKRADAARPGIGLVPAVYKMTKRINGRIQGFVITIYRINTQRDRIPSPVMEQMEASNQLMPEEAHSNFVSTSINQWLYDQMALSQQPGAMVYKDRVANGVALPAYLPNQHEISADGTEKYTLATFNRYDLGTAQGTPDTIAKRTAEFFATMGQTLEVKVISFNDAQSYFNTFTGPARAAVNWFFTGDPPDEGEVNTQRRRRRDDGDVGVCFAHPPGQRNTLGEFYTLGDMTALPTELGCPIFGGFGNSSSSVPDDTTADDPPTCFGLDDQK